MIPAPRPVRARLAVVTERDKNCQYCLSAHTCTGTQVAEADAKERECAATPGPPARTPPGCRFRPTPSAAGAAASTVRG